MPPVGQKRTWGNGEASDFRYAMPPDASAGKNFISVMPVSSTVITSETVAVPGRQGSPVCDIAANSDGVAPGDTRKLAPASAAFAAWSGVVIVPAPTTMSGTSSAIARIASTATGVRSVSSIAGSPPATSALASGTASATRSMTTTGMTGTRSNTDVDTSSSRVLDNGHLLLWRVIRGEHTRSRIGRPNGSAERGEQLPAGAGPLLALR